MNERPHREEGFQRLAWVAHRDDEGKSAGDYVTKYMHREDGDGSHAFALDPNKVAKKEWRPRDRALV